MRRHWSDVENEVREMLILLHRDWDVSLLPQIDEDTSGFASPLVVSCQLVLSTYQLSRKFSVVDFCFDIDRYQAGHRTFFDAKDATGNKVHRSIIAITSESKEALELGWLKNRPTKIVSSNDRGARFPLSFREGYADALFEEFANEEESEFYWNQWADFMFDLYPECNSVFSENLYIGLKQPVNCAIFLAFSQKLVDNYNKTRQRAIARRCWKFLADYVHHDTLVTMDLHLHNSATRAAISQVMARNMSHNIGSHVLSKFKNSKDVSSDDQAGRYASFDGAGLGNQYQSAHQILYSADTSGLYTCEKCELENRNQIAYFNEYLKNRMDFLADIATAEPVIETSMLLYNEVFKGFDRNRILLNRISGISGNFRYRIVLRKDGHDLDRNNDVSVAMTNDILGAQAFYVIVENIIRNIAKHTKTKPQAVTQDNEVESNAIVITIDIREYYDPHSEKTEVTALGKEYYEVQIVDSIERTEEEINEVVLKRNRAFDLSILNKETRELRSADLGTVEMDVCAAYMRKIPITIVEENDYRPFFEGMENLSASEKERLQELVALSNHNCMHYPGEVLNEYAKDERHQTRFPKLMFAFRKQKEGSYSLGYKFYLKKPQEILVIVNREEDFILRGMSSRNELSSYGIRAITASELTDELQRRDTVFNHQLMYCDLDEWPEEVETHKAKLPKRRVDKLPERDFTNATVLEFGRLAWEKYASDSILVGQKVALRKGNATKVISVVDGLLNLGFEQANEIVRTVLIDDHDKQWEQRGSNYYEMGCHHSTVSRDDYQRAFNADETSELCGQRPAGWTISQYLETVFTKVLLIDERIQENLANERTPKLYANRVDFYEYFKQQNVLIPRLGLEPDSTTEPNLNETSFGSIAEISDQGTVAFKIREFISDNLTDARFCVIHLGVLEKLLEPESGKERDDIARVINALMPRSGRGKCELIITSGRGEPGNVPSGISFVPLAPIQNALETVFDKSVLTKLLFNSRELVES